MNSGTPLSTGIMETPGSAMSSMSTMSLTDIFLREHIDLHNRIIAMHIPTPQSWLAASAIESPPGLQVTTMAMASGSTTSGSVSPKSSSAKTPEKRKKKKTNKQIEVLETDESDDGHKCETKAMGTQTVI